MADTVDPDPPPPPPEEVPTAVAVTQPMAPIPPDAPPPRQGCLDKRSPLEKALLVLIIIIIIIVVLCAAAFLIYYFFSSPPEGTCLSDDCVKAASRLKQRMDDKIDPCTDFYKYACGTWIKKESLSPTEVKRDTFSIVEDDVNLNLRYLLQEPVGPDDPPYKAKPRKFYKGCMDLSRIEERRTEPFFEFLLDPVGKFPTLDPKWNKSAFSLEDMIINLAKLGETPLFSITVERDIDNPDKNKVHLGDAVLSLKDRKYYTSEAGINAPILQQRKKWLVDVLVLLEADKATAEADMENVTKFEMEVARITREQIEKDSDKKYESRRISSLQTEYSGWIQWSKTLRDIGENPTRSNFIKTDETIILRELAYLKKLGDLIQKTDERVLANYLMSNLLKYTVWLDKRFTDLYDYYMKDTMNISGMERWKRCTKQATEVFPEAVSRLFVEEHFIEKAQEMADTMVADLRKAFLNMIISNRWMTVETKENARAKLDAMETKVGYPNYLMDDAMLNEVYKDIPSESHKYMETMIASLKFKMTQKLKSIEDGIDRKKWTRIFPANVESGFYQPQNELTFPAAFLQPPLFSPEYPSSMNYAGAGAWLGRDLIKGFDKRGSRYDSRGIINPWWTDEDREGYSAESTCFVDQYGCYKWDGNSVDGEMTLPENVADNAGLKQSYKAYRAFIKRQGTEEKRLPGLKLDHKQIFFLSFAQTYCAKFRDEEKESMLEIGPHSPHHFRVHGALVNSKEFAEAFKCPMGSRMNPSRKCAMF